MSGKDSEITSDEMVVDLHESSKPSISGSSDSVELDGKTGYPSGVRSQGSAGSFISDVDSVAWGLCGDTCDKYEEASFQELLFVSGKQGVVVHAFSQYDESSEVIKHEQASDAGEGEWVEWGPATTLSPTFEVQKELRTHNKASERSNTFHVEATVDDGRSASPKIWMHTLLTKVERVTSGGYIYTRFPKRPLFPNNAVVSFKIFDQDSQFLDLLSPGSKASHDQTTPIMPVVGCTISNPEHSSTTTLADDSASSSRSGVLRSSYKCVKVFSNNSHRLVGFALFNVSSTPVKTSDLNDGNYVKVLVSVARTVSWGIQWLYSAKLDEKQDADPFEWIDFSFSDRFLICLSTSGTISLYGAMTGEHVASLNVLRINEAGYFSSSWHQIGNLTIKGKFKRLFVFPHSLLLGVMDESGIIYVIPTENHVLEDHFSFEDFLPYQYYSDLGLLTGWEVGGAEVGYQRVLSNTSLARGISRLAGHGRHSCFLPSKQNLKVEHSIKYSRSHNDSNLRTFSSETQIWSEKKSMLSEFPSCLMRKAFIPPSGCSEDDVICCSHFGVTRLIKRCSYEKKWCQVVHANLQLDLVVNDDTYHVTPAGKTSCKEAVGCYFNGFLYLVTKKGLSVVLPSISVPQNHFPVEAIGYSLRNCSSSIKYGAGDLMGGGGTKKPVSPWKVEVLDRVLLYEGPEVAEKLCLENGKNLLISIQHSVSCNGSSSFSFFGSANALYFQISHFQSILKLTT